eukprot:1336693-Pyramimonas_sp.AAC.1
MCIRDRAGSEDRGAPPGPESGFGGRELGKVCPRSGCSKLRIQRGLGRQGWAGVQARAGGAGLSSDV